MAILGLKTVNNVWLIEVDADPSISGITAPLGSMILWNTGSTGRVFVKTNTADTDWTESPNAPGSTGQITTILPNDVAAAGTLSSFARADHKHAISVASATAQTPDQANAAGASTSFARADHVHNIATAAPSVNLTATTTNTQGVAATFARSDHSHAITTAAASTQTPDQANAVGSATGLARADHVHNIPTAAAVAISTSSTNAQGVAATFARSDHTHAVTLTNTHVSATADFTVTSGTDALVTTMTTTPASGTYAVWASCTVTVTAGGNDAVTMSIYSGGTQATGTARTFENASGFNNAQSGLASHAVVTVNGSQAIEMRARQSGGNQTVGHRTLTILKVG